MALLLVDVPITTDWTSPDAPRTDSPSTGDERRGTLVAAGRLPLPTFES